MAKRMTPEEAKAKLARQQRIRERFGNTKKDDDCPSDEDAPEGDFGPSSELSHRRMLRDIKESGEEDDG